MRLHALIPLLLVATSCNDQGVTKSNALPEVHITSHQSGDVVLEGVAIEFRGLVGDPDNTSAELFATWFLGNEEACAEASLDSGGITACAMALGLDDSEVRLEARDIFNDAASTEVVLSVEPTAAPEAAILSPLEDVVYYSDRLVTFEGSISDAEDAPDLLVATWSSDGEPLLEVSSLPDSNGKILGTGYLSMGEHLVALDVQDTTGKTGQDYLFISVKETNSAPGCAILAPESGLVVEEGTLVSFEAQVDDVDIPEEQIAVSWSSDWDGDLGSSSPNSAGEVAFSTSTLSAHTHTVTMVASDEVGVTCFEVLVLTVGRAPAISITMPTEGEEFAMGDPIRFEALVSDDGPASDLVVAWESSLVIGELHAEQADAKGQAGFTTYDLPAGEQVVTATVTDPEGLRSTDAITIRVQACTATWYPDLDGDGYGGIGPVVSCAAPVGYVAQAGDCDDTDALIHPSATETCDGVDEDCDGSMDEADASDALTWYIDLDGDGFGDGASGMRACLVPSGYLRDDGDCDDGNADVNPNATEICNGIDDDCDGTSDSMDPVDALCPAEDCVEVLAMHPGEDGLYWIDPRGTGTPYQVYCDLSTEGGGWTLTFVASDDGSNTWTWTNRLLMSTDTALVGDVTAPDRDMKSQAHHDILFADLLFIHSPSGITAEYEGVGDHSLDLGNFIDSIPSPNCDMSLAGNGFPLTGGTLTLGGMLCDTDLYFNLGDTEGGLEPYNCSDLSSAWNHSTYGPSWSVSNNDGCPFDDPMEAALGPCNPCPECGSGAGDQEYGALGIGWALGLNTGAGGMGENHLWVLVR